MIGRDRSPWYARDGLRFRCTACGACCRRPGEVHLSVEEANRIAARILGDDASAASLLGELWVETPEGGLRIDVDDGEACPLLGEDDRCSVHDIKPLQCATYPFWNEVVASRWTWRREAFACEGIRDDGDRYAASAVADLVAGHGRTRDDE